MRTAFFLPFSIFLYISEVATQPTWVLGATQKERSRENIGSLHPADCHGVIFQRLAQHFQRSLGKFRELVQKQYAVVTQRHFPRNGNRAAADQGA